MYDPLKCCRLIVACFILHNICIQNNLPLEDEDDDEGDDEGGDDEHDENGGHDNGRNVAVRQINVAGLQARRQLINARFQNI